MKVDKSVCTNEFENHPDANSFNRAQNYGAVFTTLLEKKIIAIKRETEKNERKRKSKKKQSSSFSGKLSSNRKFCIKRNDSDDIEKLPKVICSIAKTNLAPTHETCSTTGKAVVRPITFKLCNENTNPAVVDDNINTAKRRFRDDINASIGIRTENKSTYSEISWGDTPLLNTSEKMVCANDAVKSFTINLNSSVNNFETDILTNEISKNCLQKRQNELDRSVKNKNQTLGLNSSPPSSIFEIYLSDDSFSKSGKSSIDTTIDTTSLTSDKISKLRAHSSIQYFDKERKRLRLLEAKSISAQCSPIFQRALRNRIEVKNDAKYTSDEYANAQFNNLHNADMDNKNGSILQSTSSLLLSKYKYNHKKYDKIVIHDFSNDNKSQGFINSFNQLTSNNNNSINVNFPVTTTTKKNKSVHCNNNRQLSPYYKCNTEPKTLHMVPSSNDLHSSEHLENHQKKCKKYSK